MNLKIKGANLKVLIIVLFEVLLLMIALVLGGFWVSNPSGNFEPYIVVITIFLMVIEAFRRHKNNTEDAEFQISNVSVDEIVNEINNSPPFQKDVVAERYNGLIVIWVGYLHKIERLSNNKNKVKVNLRTKNEFTLGCYYIWFDLLVKDFPDIQHINSGTAIQIKGKIISSSGGGLCSTLQPITVKLIEK